MPIIDTINAMERPAFTLVELLVVIAIIGLLSTVGAVALGSSRKNARNAKRIADVKQLVTAFGLGLDASGSYPSTGGNVWKCISSSCYSGWSAYTSDAAVDAFFTPFLNKPSDPSDGNARGQGGYAYNGASPDGGPTIRYTLESPAATCGPGVFGYDTGAFVMCVMVLR
jgi:prepilin-type N-terminal cleavage/methylation domain-containing protein